MGEGGEWSGKVVFVTGVARGQGRSHALEFARRGADVGGLDLCAPIATVPYDLASPAELKQTAEEIRSLGGRAVLEVGDVRDPAHVRAVVARVLDSFGHIDVVVTNAGVFSVGDPLTLSPETWRDVLDVNLTGVWNTVQACLPTMVEGGPGRQHRDDELDRRGPGSPGVPALRREQAWGDRADAGPGERARALPHQGERRVPDERQHAHDPEPGELPELL